MNLKELYKTVLFYLTAPKCVCCGDRLVPGNEALCGRCLDKLLDEKSYGLCSMCFKPLYECTCTNDYLERHYIHKLVKVFRYKPSASDGEKKPQNELIYNLKRGHRRDIVRFIAADVSEPLSLCLNGSLEDYVITNVPRQKARRTKYGVDHSQEIAKEIGRILRIEYKSVLKSNSKQAQKKTKGEERIKNAAFDYKGRESLQGRRVIIFDDIVTTGASMGACATLLKGLGAKSIIGACYSIAYRDSSVYSDFK